MCMNIKCYLEDETFDEVRRILYEIPTDLIKHKEGRYRFDIIKYNKNDNIRIYEFANYNKELDLIEWERDWWEEDDIIEYLWCVRVG